MSEGGNRFFHGCLVASFMFVVLLLLGAILSFVGCCKLFSAAEKACKEKFEKSSDVWEEDEDMNRGSDADDSAHWVLHITLKGEISADEEEDIFGLHDDTSAPFALLQVREAINDADIEGIFLDVDSPGGEVTMSDDLWAALNDFKKTGRPITAFFGSYACSGAYYASACADRIIARPTTITGSIGVKIESFNVKQLADKLGVKPVSVTSGENKNILSPFEDMTDEQRALIENIVTQMYDRFVSIVADGRKMDVAKVLKLADGRIYTAKDALAEGLIDGIGYLDDAIDATSGLFDGEDVFFVKAVSKPRFLDMLGSSGFLDSCVRRAAKEAVAGAISEASETKISFK